MDQISPGIRFQQLHRVGYGAVLQGRDAARLPAPVFHGHPGHPDFLRQRLKLGKHRAHAAAASRLPHKVLQFLPEILQKRNPSVDNQYGFFLIFHRKTAVRHPLQLSVVVFRHRSPFITGQHIHLFLILRKPADAAEPQLLLPAVHMAGEKFLKDIRIGQELHPVLMQPRPIFHNIPQLVQQLPLPHGNRFLRHRAQNPADVAVPAEQIPADTERAQLFIIHNIGKGIFLPDPRIPVDNLDRGDGHNPRALHHFRVGISLQLLHIGLRHNHIAGIRDHQGMAENTPAGFQQSVQIRAPAHLLIQAVGPAVIIIKRIQNLIENLIDVLRLQKNHIVAVYADDLAALPVDKIPHRPHIGVHGLHPHIGGKQPHVPQHPLPLPYPELRVVFPQPVGQHPHGQFHRAPPFVSFV